jgi:hypothetical protein
MGFSGAEPIAASSGFPPPRSTCAPRGSAPPFTLPHLWPLGRPARRGVLRRPATRLLEGQDGQALVLHHRPGRSESTPDDVAKTMSPADRHHRGGSGCARGLGEAASDPAKLRSPFGPGRHRYEFQFTGISTSPLPRRRLPMAAQRRGRQEWVDGGDQREAHLQPACRRATTVSEVRARNNDGVWSVEPATLVSFSVAPFILAASCREGSRHARAGGLWHFICFVAGSCGANPARTPAFEYERSLEQQRFRHKQAMQAERARIAAELHDDLGANLTQIQWLGRSGHASEAASPPP